MITDFRKYFKDMAKLLLAIAVIAIIAGLFTRLSAQEDNCLGSGIGLPRDVVISDTCVVYDGMHTMRFIVYDTIRAAKYSRRDSTWSYELSHYAHYSRIELGRRMNNGIKYIDKSKRNFWTGTSCMTMASACYIAAAWSDPVIYVESTKRFTWDYYHNAKFKRDALITGGVLFTAIAILSYGKMYKNGKQSRWYISPNGIRYNF